MKDISNMFDDLLVVNIDNDENGVLRKKSKDVVTDNNLIHLSGHVSKMVAKCKEFGGVGIALPQIGLNRRGFIIRLVSGAYKPFFNPVIVLKGVETTSIEGCLSVSNRKETIKRNSIVHISYYDEFGKYYADEVYTGLEAIIIQHEYDHLEGVLYIDRIEKYICPNCRKEHTNDKGFCDSECYKEYRKNKKKGL